MAIKRSAESNHQKYLSQSGNSCSKNGGAVDGFGAMGAGGRNLWMCEDGTVRWK